jgi:CBS domain containing-hemolysin-like protein
VGEDETGRYRRFTVLEVDHSRIARVRVEKLPDSRPAQ